MGDDVLLSVCKTITYKRGKENIEIVDEHCTECKNINQINTSISDYPLYSKSE